jgi:PPM family protein phosphatase
VAFSGPQPLPFDSQDGPHPPLCVSVAPITDLGRKRRNNQDNHLVLPLDGSGAPQSGEQSILGIEKAGLLLAIADGMGGHSDGEVASRMCVENLAREAVSRLSPSGSGHADLLSALQEAVVVTHRALYYHAQEHAQGATMGTTLTAALLIGERAEVAQVGDSRAYLFRNGGLALLTQDQTIENKLRARGEDFSLVDMRIREMLTQAVGAQADIEVIMTTIDLEPQDFLLLCSDGLHKMVPPAEIVDVLELNAALGEKATQLVAQANAHGGPDNITAILVEICEAGPSS